MFFFRNSTILEFGESFFFIVPSGIADVCDITDRRGVFPSFGLSIECRLHFITGIV